MVRLYRRSNPSPCPHDQTIAVGETYEFDYQAPAGRKTAWLDVRTPGGKWQVQGHVIIKEGNGETGTDAPADEAGLQHNRKVCGGA